jgi:hypothetical protein
MSPPPAADPLFDNNAPSPVPGAGPAKKPGLFGRLFGRKRAAASADGPPAKRSRWRWVPRILILLALLYYPVGMVFFHRIGDDTKFTVIAKPGESRAVAIVIALIDREVNQHRWTPNDPLFMPTAALDNLPNFQMGMIAGISRFSIEMQDKIGRARGSSPVDKDLEKAAGFLRIDPRRWIIDFQTSVLPTRGAEAEYRAAMKHLRAYNTRLAAGKAVFERRADNLQTLIDRVNADLGSVSAALSDRVLKRGGQFFDTRSDDIFYRAKGQLYAYYLILRELGQDFKSVIAEKDIGTVWAEMLKSLEAAAKLQPLIVRNGAPDGMLMPNHLAAQGFFLLRARVQLKEIADILQK